MKSILFIVLLTFTCFAAFAQIDFKSGSAEIDADLNSINLQARLDFGAFKTQLKVNYQVDDKKIDYMSATLKMEPAEIYYALEIGKYTKKPVDEIITIYKKEKSNGWGNIAKQAGIKPGSAEFHAMKSNANAKGKKGKENGKGNGKGNSQKNKGKGNKK